MADKTIFGRLQKLFSTSTIVRKTQQGVKVIDTDEYQNMTTNLVDRFMKLKVTIQTYFSVLMLIKISISS